MSGYIDIIKESFVTFPIVALFITLPYMIVNYRKFGSIFSIRVLIIYSFVLYLLCVYFLVILPLPDIEYVASLTTAQIQPIPFMFVADIIKDAIKYHSIITPAVLQITFNVIMTIPFGMYLHYYFRLPIKKVILYSFLLSLFFELTQLSGLYFTYPRSYRLFDVDDLMSNTLGGTIGFYLINPLKNILPDRDKIDESSYRLGHTISLMRKVFAVGLDYVISIIVIIILIIIFGNSDSTVTFKLLPLYVIYFTLMTTFNKGQTFGYKFMKIKVVSHNEKWPDLLVFLARYILVHASFYILMIPVYFVNMIQIYDYRIAGYVVCIFVDGLLCLFEFIKLCLSKPLIYEKLTKTEFVSTIEIEQQKKDC